MRLVHLCCNLSWFNVLSLGCFSVQELAKEEHWIWLFLVPLLHPTLAPPTTARATRMIILPSHLPFEVKQLQQTQPNDSSLSLSLYR